MNPLTPQQLDAIRPLGTSLVADAIEALKVRLPNQGFIAGTSLRCMTPDLGPMLGYAVPARVRTAHPPMGGARYAENAAWWEYIRKMPMPRIVVVEDCDVVPGMGAFIGPLHAKVKSVLGCIGVVTNGAVREVSKLRGMGFHTFAAQLSVTRAHAHVTEFGREVRLGGLAVEPGDLLYGDENGVLSIPAHVALQIPRVAAEIESKRQKTRDLCEKQDVTTEELRAITELLGFAVGETSVLKSREKTEKTD